MLSLTNSEILNGFKIDMDDVHKIYKHRIDENSELLIIEIIYG